MILGPRIIKLLFTEQQQKGFDKSGSRIDKTGNAEAEVKNL